MISIQVAASRFAENDKKKSQGQHLARLVKALKNLERHCTVFKHLEGTEKETHYWEHILTELLYLTDTNGLLLPELPSDLDSQIP